MDNDKNTYWHSCYSGACTNDNYPYDISIDTDAMITVNGFAFTQRQNLSRSIKDIEILTSEDNTTWSSLGNFTLLNSSNVQNITLDNQATFRYFKIIAKTSNDGNRFASLAEFYCY